MSGKLDRARGDMRTHRAEVAGTLAALQAAELAERQAADARVNSRSSARTSIAT